MSSINNKSVNNYLLRNINKQNFSLSNIPDIILKEPIIQPIYLLQQFFISNNKERQKEINFCLRKNIENNLFTKIILINEKIYSKEELGIDDLGNIIQINIGNRLMFSDVFKTVKNLKLKGYIVFSNSDIIFHPSLKNVYKSSISIRPIVQCLTRYNIINIKDGKFKYELHGDTNSSQDTWILHSKFIPQNVMIGKFDFNFGRFGCDNHILYLFNHLKYLPKNEYTKYITFHYHLIPSTNYLQDNFKNKNSF